MDVEDEIESILFIIREISIYKIPPLKVNAGHRAMEWGDLSNPLWKGRLRIVEKSSGASLLFEDAQTVFAKTAYDPDRPSVEAVLDSSRYFVVRIEDAGKKAYIGLGFAERTDSFDFNVALQDYSKRYRAALHPSHSEVEEIPSPHVPAGPKKDYSLKEGETFTIAIPGRSKHVSSDTNLLGSTTQSSSQTSAGGAFPLLPPPPSSKRRS
ncbi:adaptin ear-binding coat-associated protein 1 NECAP-1 [Guyanagaster necrorhizus]|uniref:Adaptin ear-binding coat-associated protein 1 NECAP-1 n=1 Tax=Guyanagaster necrorhizus TaxID=856835 RepID=A0A9P8AUG3_9AGAR|nr:adaptin ear-binding coat-associated protein 1 NECAP-1 [Guyanagaster necrorhizus MCA 3950]KAG7448220.1 adaptin ear-binding coat-associated protein 1 NECAP-1 [Guyanagaster necrorhizus MCA 3950]